MRSPRDGVLEADGKLSVRTGLIAVGPAVVPTDLARGGENNVPFLCLDLGVDADRDRQDPAAPASLTNVH